MSEMDPIEFRERIATLIANEQPFAWAKRVGVPSATFDRMWNGNSIPRAEHLLQIARAHAVTVDWLLTGEGELRPGDAEAVPPPAPTGASVERDADLYGRVLEAVSAVYKECGWQASLRQIGEKAAQIADDIAVDGLAPEEKPAAVKAAAAMLRRQLRDAVANPAAGVAAKHRA